MKESLLHMRRHSSVVSSTSVIANASNSVRSLPEMTGSQSQHEDSNISIACVASELTRYALDDDDLTSSLVVGDKTQTMTVAGEAAMSSSDPCVMNVALQHQQLRAEVLNTPTGLSSYSALGLNTTWIGDCLGKPSFLRAIPECFVRLSHRLGVRPSVCLSAHPSIRHWHCIKRNLS